MGTALIAAFTVLFAQTQTPGAATEFEVVSIRPAGPSAGDLSGISGGPGTSDPGHLHYNNIALRDLLVNAFNTKRDQLNGPGWMDSQRFDLTVKVPYGATRDQLPAMLQKMLAERFHLTFHKEIRQQPIFVLVRAKGELKIKVSADATPAGSTIGFAAPGTMRMTASHMPMERLASTLSNLAGRVVVDKTSLKQTYDFTLLFAPEPAPDAEVNAAPGIFSALRDQLGLRLEPDKGPQEIVVIDSVDRAPTEN